MVTVFDRQLISTQCLVVGDGPAGLAAAAALALDGLDVVVTRKPPVAAVAAAAGDTRTAALFPPSIAFLEALGAWTTVRDASAVLAGIRLVDATAGLLRAPEVLFRPAEIGWPNFGYNVPQDALVPALAAAAERAGARVHRTEGVAALEAGAREAIVTTREGERLSAALVVAADGRGSLCRSAVGIRTRTVAYPQSALATRFSHGRAHRGISTELHTQAGPCTTVPMPAGPDGRAASSLVWVERPSEAERLAALDEHSFLDALEARLQGVLGTLSDAGPRRTFPLRALAAETLGRQRVALIGEAAHVIPPIGAQGLNLGLVDAATLVDCVRDALDAGRDIGGADTLAAYSASRRADIGRRTRAVDLLNRSLISGFWPVSLARGLGLHVIAALPALRARLMREGLEPPHPWPRLMRSALDELAPGRPAPLHHGA